jgi:site-specific recombinase XerD
MAKKPRSTWANRIDEFARYLAEQERSGLTLANYHDDLGAFAVWHENHYAEPPKLDDLGATEIREWKAHLLGRQLKPQTVNRKLSAMRSFIRWGSSRGLCRSVQTPKTVRQEVPKPRWMNRKEELALLRAVDRAGDDRDSAIIKLFLNVGFRVSELASLKWAAVRITDRKGRVEIVGKGRKHRTVPLNADAREAFIGLGYEKNEGLDTEVLRGQRGPLTPRGAQFIVERHAAAAKLPEVSCHVLRHTFCRRLAEANVRLEVIAALAGHESIQTTRQYVEPGQEDLRAAVDSLGSVEAID